jgi:hypothetical protein
MDNDTCDAFKAAFAWFDGYRWAWVYDPDATSESAGHAVSDGARRPIPRGRPRMVASDGLALIADLEQGRAFMASQFPQVPRVPS